MIAPPLALALAWTTTVAPATREAAEVLAPGEASPAPAAASPASSPATATATLSPSPSPSPSASPASAAVREGPAPPGDDRLARLESRLDAVEAENRALKDEVELLREDQTFQAERLAAVMPLAGRLGGYVDFGLFWAGGNGSGVRPDIGHKYFPEYDGVVPDSWTFMGDPLSTTINSRGDVADTGESRAVTFDPVDSQGKSSFIVNALNLNVFTGVGKYAAVEGLVDFLPRGRDVANPSGLFLGDYVDVKLAYLRVNPPIKRFDLEISAGKIDSIVGYEYRGQEAPDRITVTPSLVCRYNCGRPVGLKFRARFLERRSLIAGLSVTNGSSIAEGFGFTSEIDRNNWKTLSGRLGYVIPAGSGLEIGASGYFGAQDLQKAEDVHQWQYGFDLHLDVAGVDLAGEFVMGKLQGQTEAGGPPCGLAACLEFKAAYGLIGYRALNWLMPYFRTDWRSALHQNGASFVYNSDLVRFTPGLRFEAGTHVIIKVEYTVNRELGRIPQFPNDVFTTSVVAKI
ncbi:MAG: bZIP transcription factor [Nannocystaceae bacterium]